MCRFYRWPPEVVGRMGLRRFRAFFAAIGPIATMESGETPPKSRDQIKRDLARARAKRGLKLPKGL